MADGLRGGLLEDRRSGGAPTCSGGPGWDLVHQSQEARPLAKEQRAHGWTARREETCLLQHPGAARFRPVRDTCGDPGQGSWSGSIHRSLPGRTLAGRLDHCLVRASAGILCFRCRRKPWAQLRVCRPGASLPDEEENLERRRRYEAAPVAGRLKSPRAAPPTPRSGLPVPRTPCTSATGSGSRRTPSRRRRSRTDWARPRPGCGR